MAALQALHVRQREIYAVAVPALFDMDGIRIQRPEKLGPVGGKLLAHVDPRQSAELPALGDIFDIPVPARISHVETV